VLQLLFVPAMEQVFGKENVKTCLSENLELKKMVRFVWLLCQVMHKKHTEAFL